MNSENENLVLAAIGLKPKIGREDLRESDLLHSVEFDHYVRSSYRDSPEYGTDEIHRMYETIRIHKPTGIRFYCLSHESWDGQSVEYSLYRLHIITRDGKTLDVLSLDLNKKIITTPEGEVSFDRISADPAFQSDND